MSILIFSGGMDFLDSDIAKSDCMGIPMILQADIPLAVSIFNRGELKVGVDDLYAIDSHLDTIADAAN